MKGKFIVIEGIDGAGTTTQSLKLMHNLFNYDKRMHVVLTREPTRSAKCAKLMELLKGKNPRENAEDFLQAFYTDRVDHVEGMVNPNLSSGVTVISDRYDFSTFAYQGVQGISIGRMVEMHSNLPKPDIMFLIDVPAKEAVRRMNIRTINTVFEKEDFLELVRQKYLEYANLLSNSQRIHVIDGTKPIEEISAEIFEIVKTLYTETISI